MERAGCVGVAVDVSVAETALEVGVVNREDHSRDDQNDYDDERESTADENCRQHRATPGRDLRTKRSPGRPIPVLQTIVGDPTTLRILPWHESIMKGPQVGPSQARALEDRI